MVARREIVDQSLMEEYESANCLALLPKVGVSGVGERRVFRCKTCMREFSSFQALGGHRASHKKPIVSNAGDLSTMKANVIASSHTCPICRAEFPMGQALGGHMRRHRNDKENSAGTLVTRSFLPVETSSTMTTLKKSSSGKRVERLDLGYYDTAETAESSINLDLKLGTTIY